MIIGLDASRANQKERTGTERYAWEVIRRLPTLLPEHTIRLYVREALRPDLQNLGPNVETRILDWRPGIVWSHVRLSWELWRHPPDVLFVPANTVPLIHPPRTITTIHDVAFERYPELYRGRSVQRRLGWLRPLAHVLVRIFTLGRYSASERDYHRWSSRHALRSSRIILTVSEFSRQEIIQLLNANPEQIVVTPLGVDQSQPNIQPTPRLQDLERPFILFVGRLEKKKNIDGLVNSYLRYRQLTQTPSDLVLAGAPGYGWEDVADRLNSLQHHHQVHQLGWVSPREMSWLERHATFLWFVTRYEGFGLPPLECIASGVPVPGSRAGSLPEVLDSAASFVSTDEPETIALAMHRLSTDEGLRQQLITRGRDWAQQFTWDRTAHQTAEQIRTLVGLPISP